jgi:hypothetical protein
MNKNFTRFVLFKNNVFGHSNIAKKVDTKSPFCYNNDMLIKTALNFNLTLISL